MLPVYAPIWKNNCSFFYDGPVSREVAFGALLKSGENFAGRLLGLYSKGEEPQLAHIATDGESYGHHHRFGDMALAYALHNIESGTLARLTNYGEYLEKYPLHTRWRSLKIPHGVVLMELRGGGPTADATQVYIQDGLKRGAHLCERP